MPNGTAAPVAQGGCGTGLAVRGGAAGISTQNPDQARTPGLESKAGERLLGVSLFSFFLAAHFSQGLALPLAAAFWAAFLQHS